MRVVATAVAAEATAGVAAISEAATLAVVISEGVILEACTSAEAISVALGEGTLPVVISAADISPATLVGDTSLDMRLDGTALPDITLLAADAISLRLIRDLVMAD